MQPRTFVGAFGAQCILVIAEVPCLRLPVFILAMFGSVPRWGVQYSTPFLPFSTTWVPSSHGIG